MKEIDECGFPAYEIDSYRRRLTTEVVRTGVDDTGHWAQLRDSILYPEGGGQPADHGTIGGMAVVDVQVREGVCHHYLREAVSLGQVEVELDWQRRYDHMQHHTGQHLLSALADDECGWKTTSFHLGAERCDIELDAVDLAPGDLVRLEERVAEAIRAGHPVRSRRVTALDYAQLGVRSRGLPADHAGDIRLIEIAGCDLNTCGGTHLRSTAEIEALHLLGSERMRGGTRLYFIAGRRARQRMRQHEGRLAELRHLLDTGDANLVEQVRSRLDQIQRISRRERDLLTDLADALAAGLAARPQLVVAAHFPQHGADLLRSIASALLEAAPTKVALLTAGKSGDGAFTLVAGERAAIDPIATGREVATLLDGRGGGKGRQFHGKASSVDKHPAALAYLIERQKQAL